MPEAEDDMRVYLGFARALLSVADVGPLAPAKGSDAEIAAGVAVYRNNVRAAWLGVLRETIPVVERLVGEEFFRYVAHEYFHATKPSSRLVARYGDGLPDFIERFLPAAKVPYLADVARLERAWLEAYHAADATPMAPEEVFESIAACPDYARLGLHPSMRLLSSPYAVHAIWRHNRERRDEKLALAPSGERVLIHRPNEQVLTETIPAELFAALSALSRGATLGEALDAAIGVQASLPLSEVIRRIASAGVVVSASKARRDS